MYLYVCMLYYATLFITSITYLNFLGWLTFPGMHFTTAPRGNKCLDISHPTVVCTKLFHFFSSFWQQLFLPLDGSFNLLTINPPPKNEENLKGRVLHVIICYSNIFSKRVYIAMVFTGGQNVLNWTSLYDNLSSGWSNQTGKIILYANSQSICPVPSPLWNPF